MMDVFDLPSEQLAAAAQKIHKNVMGVLATDPMWKAVGMNEEQFQNVVFGVVMGLMADAALILKSALDDGITDEERTRAEFIVRVATEDLMDKGETS